MSERFQQLLHELSQALHLSLHIDSSQACTLLLPGELKIQLQPDLSQEALWIFAKLAEIAPGKFRENVLCEALKANSLPDPRAGQLAYLQGTNHLVLFQKYPFDILNGERLAQLLGAFTEVANSWTSALASGQSAPRSLPPSNPFGR